MSGLLAGMTLLLTLIPVVFLGSGVALLGGVGAFVALLYAWIGLYMRPRAFELTSEHLEIVWPLRTRRIPKADVMQALAITAPELKREFGTLLRVGAGGFL